ncbi:disease resistance protein RGA5-like [Oryza sativa Japonica Group]|uniref:disease resistance protein RGA5-like n=1 Tax=Oryza sativa subsp. japonica TaxID=39947 RepID=UPI0007753A83|nr:disease resistance protein RGA5-like [Oryza sativa Japonica Group]XP_015620725.1 disease resistance protein RGA5-like [Oryza sativa Japonica Group]XP_015620726.1 disease resistance protein RGA5-like [Oryza sativa Japonica Group]XP_015620727.1 disease resistance protein RGA5-like [Oryza sativa Japonica Group]XP_015620729.1 disease resistance protein RGA5-like [Oryza sativa Japonica Group]XP_015620730.1 disease resistance protein RGA5-like [Oryza sativa Japonica Group]XP_015620731.1 disease 
MASASSGAINSLLSKLAALMGEEYGKLRGVRKEVASLEDELRSMRALLEKLAAMDELDGQAKEWRDQVREMSYDIEDCIDDFLHQLDKNNGSNGFVHKTVKFLKEIRARHQIGNSIQEIKNLVKEVSERRMRYKIDEYTPNSRHVPVDPRVVAIYSEAAGLVGIDAPRDELLKLLMGEEQGLKVASIVGFGGVGKTTLAKEVYRKLERKFDCGAFVSVSQKPDIPKLLNRILLEVRGQCSVHNTNLDGILNDIINSLRDKRYFIVVDDLWDSFEWNIIRCAFPENKYGSRVLTTTRILSVATTCCSNSQAYIYKMKSLTDQNSRNLFYSRIFGSHEAFPNKFEEVTTNILKKCDGLPLAIISIASLLSGQPYITWEYVNNSMRSMFEGNPTLGGMRQILELSYNNLPHHLKTCLLYVSMYPEDYIIKKNDLVRQWIAEGFVSKISGLDVDDVAGSYFNELINRSMVQPIYTDYNDEVLSCRIHDIMLEIIRSKSAEENFFSVIDDRTVAPGLHTKIRRVSFHYADEEDGVIPASNNRSLSQVRSAAFFKNSFRPSSLEFKYVRVLLLEFPRRWRGKRVDLTGICGFSLLRYLKISHDVKLVLPSQLGGMWHLETIELHTSEELSIPSDIVSLPHLSQLFIPANTVLPNGIGDLKSLRNLEWFDLIKNSMSNIECLGELTNLRDLKLDCSSSEPLEDVTSRIEALRCSLERLSRSSGSLRNIVLLKHFPSWLQVDGLSTLSPPPRHLWKLHLERCLFSRIPSWIVQLRDLHSLKLTIRKALPMDDGVTILACLPSLVHLDLRLLVCPEERVIFSGTGMAFRALKHLLFRCHKPFLDFKACSMPRLQKLELWLDATGW